MAKKQPLIERFQQLAGIKPLYEQLGPRMSNPRPTGPSEPGPFDDEDLTFEPEDDYVDEVELEDLDFKTLRAAFPKFYQKVKFTRTQPSGEEGPYYEDAVTFPNADDSQTVIADESSLEDWKTKTLKRFGNVEIEFNDEAENWFDRVKVYDDAFSDAKAGFTKGKQDFIDKERELGRSID